MFNPGDDVLVTFEGAEFPGEVLKLEKSGYILCRVITDPEWDYGFASPRIMPEQVVAVRHGRVRKAER